MSRLKDKVAIITGAADGIGLAISEAFVKQGAHILMADINEEKCKKETERLANGNNKVIYKHCDIGNTKAVQSLVETCINIFGKIDVLVNNAAVAIPGEVTKMTDDDWDTLMNINLKGAFRCIRACLPFMISAKHGSVINISSTQAHRSWDDWTAYAAAKGGLLSMTNQLAGQFGNKNIRFNSISPGTILTPMLTDRVKTEGEEFLKASINQASMLRCGKPEEVAMTAVFLASDEAAFINGDDIKIDGGLSTLPRYFE
ncbi:SDR family NAD(P)-dependent oxidoreductase [Hyunsoonleella pacifica]|uniref:SDR family oxidoreductase n=1 Tax=Hyunsoonleella pacifica TaxID=1080224 RepID=A0A4Q9FSA4_9FLAO|nr:SDR family oxidoreductase [Hyunsoonleella pacifica]TBN18954.1 SDR family oxidoreductase [Hyunsoonleella pacifica]GGD06116.1 3-oxoacyl-ACP reductase [Hyunsoonleella pacifica]